MKHLGMTEGFDVGLEMSGNAAAFQGMLEGDEPRRPDRDARHLPDGRVASISDQIIFKGLHLKGIYGREMFETWYKMTTMLQSGLDISQVITHRFPIDRLPGRVRRHAVRKVGKGDSGVVKGGLPVS